MSVFTLEEKQNIVDQWNLIVPDKQAKVEVGKLLFLKLFEIHPEYIELFRNFKGKTVDQIMASPAMRAHAVRFTSALGGVIESMDDDGCLVQVLHDLAESHRTRNVTPSHINMTFLLMKNVLLQKLGPSADINAWNKFFKIAEDEMVLLF